MQTNVELKLRETLAKLIAKNVDKVSVSELCEKAGVSRASFYIYYKDLDDFVDKNREYIINKLFEQMLIIMDVAHSGKDREKLLLSESDIELLKGYTNKNIYWDFALNANDIFSPRFKALMIERWGEEYYNKNKASFEFLFNGGIATLYFDLINYDKETYLKNMDYITEIVKDLFYTD